jgi:hypothetical protein
VLLPSRARVLNITKNRYIELMLVEKEMIVSLLNLVLFTVLIVLIMVTVVSVCDSDVQMANMIHI